MGNTQTKPTGYRDYVTVSDASKALGVSIDTVRRWDRAGKLPSARLDGKNRYFSVQDLEAFKATQPLSTSEVAKLLKVSPSTVRRMEQSGQLQTVRGDNGHRGFQRQQVQMFTSAKASKIPVSQASIKPATHTASAPIAVAVAAGHSAATHRLNRAKHKTRRAFLYGAAAAFSVMAVLFFSFMVAPSQTNRALSFASTSNKDNIDDWENASMWERMLRPFSDGALYAVKVVSPSTYKEVVSPQTVSDGDSDTVDGREPGSSAGNLSILPVNGSELVDQSVTSSKLADGSIELQNFSADVIAVLNKTGATGPQGPVGPAGPVGPSAGSSGGITSVLSGAGLTGGGASGDLTLSVLFGASAGTVASGSNTFICSSGSGNLTGGGTTVTLGTTGTTCANITTNSAVSFATSTASPLFTNAGNLTISATGAGNDITLTSADEIILSGFDCSSFANGGVLTANVSGEISCENDDGGAGGVSGSGTANRLALFSGASTVGDSWLIQNGSTLQLDNTRNLQLLGGTVTATTFIGAVTGNASTATALSANPTDCSANQFAISIAASGNLSCAGLSDADIPNTITIDSATTASTATAFTSNPSDCGANQFATTIASNGNLTCASLTDGDVPDSITVTLASTATTLSANPTDCSANQFATTIAASGNLTCASITDADVSNTLTASILVGTGSTSNAVDLATAEVAGNLPATRLQSAAADLGAANVTVDFSNTNGAFNTNITTDGSITATSFIGAITGNASTATALASNPTDCSANQFANAISANGNLTCANLVDADVPNSITIDLATLATTATALQSNPTDCSANQFATTIASNGNLTCASLTDGDIPDGITISLATTASALAGNPTDCPGTQFAISIVANGNLTCASLTDADVPNTITVDNATNASTATALASNPSDCIANQFATTIAANGNLSCASLVDGDIPNSITIDVATVASALQANPTDCAINQFATTIGANGNLTCASLTDGDIPDGITITLASTATALAGNPTDCSANQFANAIVASGNLSCSDVTLATQTSGDYVASFTAGDGLTGSATGEGSTPTLAVASANGGIVVSADNIALTIQTSGNALSSTTSSGSGLEVLAGGLSLLQGCADSEVLKWNETTDVWACSADAAGGVTDADKGDITVSGSGASWNIDADSAALGTDTTGNYVATLTAGNGISGSSSSESGTPTIALGNLTADWVQSGSFNISTAGDITAATFIGALTGNASTATALASNPSDCAVNQFATTIAASGNLTCASLADSDVPNTITIDLATLATSATALQSNPTDCSANQFATTIAANGNLTCASLTDGDIPDGITITLASTATALAGNPTDCSANQFANTISASGDLTCANLVDADVPNTITIDLATTATALAFNPTDCSANQFAVSIVASGNLSCSALTDADIPNTITVDVATTATTASALVSNPTDCSANQFATTIAANGNLTCASITDADVADTLTASILVGSGSTTNAVDLATAEVAGNLRASSLQSAAADLGAANVTVDFSNTNGAFNTNITTDGSITASSFIGAITGNASTATALASNPTDCSANQFANAIVASGNLTCAALTDGDIPNTITIDLATLATSATALQSNPTDCSANQFATTIAANGNLTCASLTDGDIPDGITISLATTASALASNPTDCSANQFAISIVASGNLSCAALTDADVPNTITVDNATAAGTATTASALAANPTDCSANQFATAIAASGNLTCSALTDGDIPNSITIDLASTATALASNPTDCGANQFATTIAANGNLTCASITDADVSNTLTSSIFIGSGSTTDGIDLATAEVAGNLRASNLQSAAADLGAANVTVDFGNTNGAFNTNITTDGSITAGSFIGALTGNSSTATALAANPSDCSANQFATAIAASGNLSCAALTDGDIPDGITITLASTATALAGNPTDCSANQFAISIVASGNLTCAGLTDGDIPNSITIDLATTATALATNPSDCSANQFAIGIIATGDLSCAGITDADVSDTLTASLFVGSGSTTSAIDLATAEVAGLLADGNVSDTLTSSIFIGSGSTTNAIDLATAEVAGNLLAGSLQSAPADLGAANVTVDFSNTNGAFNTNITTDGSITASSLVGALTGNASTATALAGNPTDCSANQFANAIAASGNLTCAALTDGDVPNTITIDLASTATALASNPTDCSANQFATTIAASGNLTCASLTDGDIPDGITITLASTATALASNPTDCGANQFATTIAASGNLTCASITDADVSNTLTSSLFVGSGSSTTAIDLATAEVAGNLRASNLQSAAADLGAANVTVDFGNTNGAFNTNITTDGSITAGSFIGALTGNASTATALAANPTDCGANQFATTIAASGNLTCASLTDGDIPDGITITLASTATALAANPTDCSANQFANAIVASGNLTCASLTDGDIPDGITITLAATATALAANPSDCGANSFATTIAASGALTCASLTTSNLPSAAADLGAANVTVDFSNTNGAFNTNITTDGSITAGSFIGALTGNSSTATALAGNPTDCSANQFAISIVASGNLSCSALTDGDIPDTITVDVATTATTASALLSNPSDCSANQFATTIAANGDLTCASITDADVSNTLTASLFVGSGSSTTAIDLATAEVAGNLRASNLQSAAADLGAANVTIDLGNTNGAFVTNLTLDGGITAATFTGALTGNASTATALSANPTDCSANQFANAIVASGNLTCAAITDADVPDGITVTLAATATALAANPADCSAGQFATTIAASGALTCAAILASNLPVAAADLGAANVNLNFGNTNGAFNTNLTLDGTVTAGAGLTVSAGGAAITGNSTITGTLTGLTGLTVASGGATITTGGLTVSAGNILTSSEGIEFTESDTNPTCAAGDYSIFADTSETKLKKCENGVASDLNAIPDVNSFIDTTTEAWVDADTTNLWDGTAPNITPKSANSEVLVMMTAYINTTSATDIEVTGKIMRHTSAITCQTTGTTVWTVGTFAGFTAGQVTMNAVFVDAPGTASNVQYTLCTDADSEAVTGITMNTIEFTLFEVNDAADLAEVYPTNDNSLSAGEVVTMDSSMTNGIKRSSKAYDSSAIGIVSTKPALAIGGRGGEGVGGKPIALSGRVPVKVSAINGAIRKGDMLTSSSIPGVAMKATKAGAILGVAMSDFAGEGTGSVMTFVKTAYYNGSNLREILQSISGETVTDADYGKSALAYFMNNADTTSESVDISDITTDRLAAGLEIVTPKVTANEVNTAKLVVGQNGISFVGQSGETLAMLDAEGTLSAQSITAQSLRVSLDLFADGGLTVAGGAIFNGTALFNQLVTFRASSVFEANIDINGILTLGNNAGGYASVKAGQQTVRITFSQPYAQKPVIGVSLGEGKFASYSYSNLTTSGFDIVLSEPATEDLQFSWTATSIKNPITFAQ